MSLRNCSCASVKRRLFVHQPGSALHRSAATKLAVLLIFPTLLHAQAPDRTAVIRYAAESGDGFWKRTTEPDKANISARDLFTYALALCETQMHADRLARLFELAGQMQDRDPKSKEYGNFRWYWSDPSVRDYNAVEFCMEAGAILWLRHRDAMPAGARKRFAEILQHAVEGCRRHKVRSDYTNIALMNATNLILLGEGLNKPDIAAEGYDRLDQFVRYTRENGVHEYVSPTYYGVDVSVLGLLEAFCQRDRERQIARSLLTLFWTDIAANWFPAGQRLAGSQSRTYDYLHSRGELDTALWVNGWLTGPPRGGIGAIYPALAKWQVPDHLRAMSDTKFPRLVQQCWGPATNQFRTHYLLKDVTLSTSAAYYGGWMDMPLTVDLPGDRESLRCYFIPDGRHDPYGKIKIPAGAHMKAHHLSALFTAVQRTVDAAVLVVYRDSDVPPDTKTLESHFVFPKAVDGIWLGDNRIEVATSHPVRADEAVVFRKGTAAVGIRVPWARTITGDPAPVLLVWDGNKFGALRLTITHDVQPRTSNAAAALWVRVGTSLDTDAAFHRWREAFTGAKADLTADSQKIELRVQGSAGTLALATEAPYKAGKVIEPSPTRVVLEIDGEDVGRQVLKDIGPAPAK